MSISYQGQISKLLDEHERIKTEISDLKSLLKEAGEALGKMTKRMELINGPEGASCLFDNIENCANHGLMRDVQEILSKIREKLAR